VYPVENIRKRVIDTAFICGKGSHIGSSLSLVDILAVVIKEKMDEDNEIVLSKGHGALAWYAVLTEYGYITQEMLDTFQQNDSELSVLAVANQKLKLICSTGSLGQGISVATGIAIAKKKLHERGTVYVIIGNGEANEGVVWEAAMLASQQKLDNFCVIIDHNHFQSDGNSENIIALDNMTEIWKAYGFEVYEADGHNCREICEVLRKAENSVRPVAIVFNTIKGYGVEYMENSAEWHHNRLTEERYIHAKALLEARKYD
jgi:transketolase